MSVCVWEGGVYGGSSSKEEESNITEAKVSSLLPSHHRPTLKMNSLGVGAGGWRVYGVFFCPLGLNQVI